MRPIKTIKLSDFEVDIITFLTWGEKEEIQTCIMKGANVDQFGLNGFNPEALRESKYKALEICIKEIRQNGEKISYSKEWMDNLSADDGDKLYAEVDKISNSKKKLDEYETLKALSGKAIPSFELIMELLSHEYGWLPSEIRKERSDDIEAYLDIIIARNQLKKKNDK